jgi:RNA polymerase sigma factor FliA
MRDAICAVPGAGMRPMLTTTSKPRQRPVIVDSEERQHLLIENLPEVRYIARRIHDRLPSHVLFDDLVHAGILGLIDAVDKFDPNKNVQFTSYAPFRIRGAILDSLRQLDWGPRRLRQQARQIGQVNRQLASELGRSPTEPEIAARLGVELIEFQRLLGELLGLDLGSLQVQSVDGLMEESVAVAATRLEEDPFHLTLRTEMRALLAQAIEELGGRERQVVGLYYLEELTMKEVGVILDIGESRVCQIHTTALIRLRSRLHSRISASSGAQRFEGR